MIRRAAPDDVQAIERIAANAYRPYIAMLGKKPAPMVADFSVHIRRDWVIVFERQAVIGYAILLTSGASALLDNIAVDSAAQRQGVGRALIDHTEQKLIEEGYPFYDLYTNVVMTENIRWYRHLGFAELKRIEEKGFKRVYMRKQLRP